MLKNKILCSLLLPLCVLMLVGCGFHLRGSIALPAHLQRICLQPDEPYDPLQQQLRRTLRLNNIAINSTPDQQTAILTLTAADATESMTGFNSNGQPQRYRISISFQYQLAYNDTVIRPFTTIQASREITLAPGQIFGQELLSNENEKRIVKEELLQEAIAQLMRQLATIAPLQ